MIEKNLAILPGDGIGPEIIKEGIKVLDAVASKYGHKFNYKKGLVGGVAYDKTGHPLPEETKKICDESDAIYFGAIGGPKWENLPSELTPEKGALLALRAHYDLFANLRPAIIFGPLAGAASLKEERLKGGLDILIVRELTGGIYFGGKKVEEVKFKEGSLKGNYAQDVMVYSVPEIERIARVACETSMKRGGKLISVDKANVLESSKLWRKTIEDFVGNNYPNVELKHLYVDNAAMQLATNPKQFDVIVTGNMFGDILSDLASAITGSIGMLPSASLNSRGFGLYEPVHGSAPDIAGQGKANPLAQILSGAMMLKYSFGLKNEADEIEWAVTKVLENGFRTKDIQSANTKKILTTSEMGDKVVSYLNK